MKIYYSDSRDALYEVYTPCGSSVTVEALCGVKRGNVITKDYFGDEFELPQDANEVRVHGFTGHEFFTQLWRIARAQELLSLNSTPDGFYSKECQQVLDAIKNYKHNFVSLISCEQKPTDTKCQVIEKVDKMCQFWWNMQDSIKPSHPDNFMCIWTERRHACPVIWHFWHEVQYHINAALFLDIDKDFFWENLSQYITELEAFQEEALELAKANRITTPRWHKDELEERILASIGRLEERFRVVNYANGDWNVLLHL